MDLIEQLKNEKEAMEDEVKMGIKRNWMIVGAWRDRTKIRLDDCSTAIQNQWSKPAAKLQLLHGDAENQKKAGDKFLSLDEESIITIQEELFDDLIALAETQIEVVQKLINGLEDVQLDVQLQFKRYEWERLLKEPNQRVEQINISDEEQPTKPKTSTPQQLGTEMDKQLETKSEPQTTEMIEGVRSEQQHPEQQQQQQPRHQQQQQQTTEEEPLKSLDQSILDILDKD